LLLPLRTSRAFFLGAFFIFSHLLSGAYSPYTFLLLVTALSPFVLTGIKDPFYLSKNAKAVLWIFGIIGVLEVIKWLVGQLGIYRVEGPGVTPFLITQGGSFFSRSPNLAAEKIGMCKFLFVLLFGAVLFSYLAKDRQKQEQVKTLLENVTTLLAVFVLVQKATGLGYAPFWKESGALFFGTYVNPNNAACLFGSTLPLIASNLLTRRDPKKLPWSAVSFGIVFIAFLLTFSRWGYGCFTLVFVSLIYHYLKRGRVRMSLFSGTLGGLLFLGFLYFYAFDFLQKFLLTTDTLFHPDSLIVRLQNWKDSFEMIREKPLLGFGMGSFEYIYPRFKTLNIQTIARHLENDYLQALVEIGMVGVGLLFFAAKQVFNSPPFKAPGSAAVKAALGFFLLHSIFEFNFHLVSLSLYFCTLVVLLIVPTDDAPGDSTSEAGHGWLKKGVLVGYAALLGTIFFPGMASFWNDREREAVEAADKTEYLKNALFWEPSHPLYNYKRGRALLRTNFRSQEQNRHAAEYLEKSLLNNPYNGRAYYFLGLANYFSRRSDLPETNRLLQLCIKFDPSRASNRFYIGRFYTYRFSQNTGDEYSRQMALNQFQRTLKLTPSYAPPIMNMMPALSQNYSELKTFSLIRFSHHAPFGKMLLKEREKIFREKGKSAPPFNSRILLERAKGQIARGDYHSGYEKLQKIFDSETNIEILGKAHLLAGQIQPLQFLGVGNSQ